MADLENLRTKECFRCNKSLLNQNNKPHKEQYIFGMLDLTNEKGRQKIVTKLCKRCYKKSVTNAKKLFGESEWTMKLIHGMRIKTDFKKKISTKLFDL